MTALALEQNFFALFGLEPVCRLNITVLEKAYLDLQSLVHPDRHAHLPMAERSLSLAQATHVNEAYRTLRDPLRRVQYLLQLRGTDTNHEDNTAMSALFLMEQMEWHEAVAEAHEANDCNALEKLHRQLSAQIITLYQDIERNIDEKQDIAAAAEGVRRWMFIERLKETIDNALEALND